MTQDEPHCSVKGTSRCGRRREALTSEASCVPYVPASVDDNSPLLIRVFFSLIGISWPAVQHLFRKVGKKM